MGREFELKMQASPEQLDEIRGSFEGFETIEMETTYFDTPSGALGTLRWTVRQRMENGVSVCSVKTGAVNGGRGEWEVESTSLPQAIPQLIAMGAPAELTAITAEGLVPTCGARFTRQACRQSTGDGVVEIALDSGILTGGGKTLPFAEVEVELKEGPDSAAVDFARALAQRFHLEPQEKSKFRRALELAQQ